ncbi:MAG TPA: rRNA maturation RNase YbeY [Flavisolibacter sp.]|nr:rRNA maturation RNase YbeY [Flavisolibacter sp.]
MKGSSTIQFHFPYGQIHLRHRQTLQSFLKQLLKKEGQRLDHVNYIFCSDNQLLELNQSYLRHDTYTDIITFGLSAPSEPLLADIYISIDRVKENARLFKASFTRELHRVIFHGVLHLSGYKDKTKKDAELMRSMEERYLKLYFVPRGTAR